MMIRKIQWIVVAATTVLCAACDAHIDEPDTAVRPGHVLCEDGTALSYAQYELSGKRAIAVIFAVFAVALVAMAWQLMQIEPALAALANAALAVIFVIKGEQTDKKGL